MKLLLLIILLAIFSTSDAYGFLQKEKGKHVGKQKRGMKFAKKVVPSNKVSPTTSRQTVSVSTPKPTTIKPIIKQQTMAPDVKSKVNKLQLLEKQHYNGNRELLIKHLQKQIALKKKQQIEQQNESKIDIPAQSQNIVKSKKQRRATSQPQVLNNGSSVNKNQNVMFQGVAQPKPVQQNEIRQPVNQDTIVQMPSQQENMQVQQRVSQSNKNLVQQNFNQVSNNMQLQAQQNQYNQQNVQVPQQMQQQSNQQQQTQQQQIQQQQIQQQQQQQQLQQQPQQQRFVQQKQRPVQQQPQNNLAHNFNHIEQSFLPQQELMQIQAQFQNRNNVQPQMQKQSMAVMQPMNVIKQQNAAYQTSDRSQSNNQQTHVQIQQIPQQQTSNMNNQQAHVQIQQIPQQQSSSMISHMQPAMNQMVPRQHILMPLNSLSMDPLFQQQMVLPERYVFLNNGGNNNHALVQTAAPPVITTIKPTTTLPPPTTPKPTTTTIKTTTTIASEPGGTVQNNGGDLQYQFFQKEMKKQDLEILKLELEIRALKRAEHYVPKEIEMERITNAPPPKTTTTIHPFLAFGQRKFPFDF